MKIPTSVRVGRSNYDVEMTDNLPPRIRGRALLGVRIIQLNPVNLRKRPRTEEELRETFWHELTHAILAEMDSPLFKNEAFVTKFAKHLHTAINSARFE